MNKQAPNQQASNQERHNPQHKPNQQHAQAAQSAEQTHPPAANVPTQAQIYDNLRRIGELEDKKQAIQNEIDSRTVKLGTAINHVAPDSLLYKMLSSALAKAKPVTAKESRTPTPTGSRKTSSTKRARKKGVTRKATKKKQAKTRAKKISGKKKRR